MLWDLDETLSVVFRPLRVRLLSRSVAVWKQLGPV